MTLQLLALAQIPAGSHLLDVGCGAGETCRLLEQRGYMATGVDCSRALIDRGRRLEPPLHLFVADVTKERPPCAVADAMLFECVLSALDAGQAFEKCLPLLCNHGWVLISDVYARGEPDCKESPYLRTQAQYKELLTQAGLAMVDFKDVSHVLSSFVAQKMLDGAPLAELLCTELDRFRVSRAGYCLIWARPIEGEL